MKTLTLLSLLLAAATAVHAEEPAAGATLNAAVLVDHHLGELHVMVPLQGALNQAPYFPSSGNILADAIGGAIGTAIAEQRAMNQLQEVADRPLRPLLERLPENNIQSIVRRGIGAGLARAGIDQQALAFSPADVDPKVFARMPASRGRDRWVIVRIGNATDAALPRPVSISENMRQFRIALEIEVLQNVSRNPSRALKRDVLFVSSPVAESAAYLAQQPFAADEHARLQAELEAVVADAVALALDEREMPDVARDDVVDLIDADGGQRIPGRLLVQADGRALIVTKSGTLLSLPADIVLPPLGAAAGES